IRVEYFIAAAPEGTTEFSPYSVIWQAPSRGIRMLRGAPRDLDTSLGKRVGRAQGVIELYHWKSDPASAAAPRPSTGKSSPALLRPRKRYRAEVLAAVPNVGRNEVFARL